MNNILNLLNNTNKFIFTCQSGNENIALNEISAISKSTLIKNISQGVCEIETTDSFIDFNNKISNSNLIFVRHLQPVNKILDLNSNFDLNNFLLEFNEFSNLLSKDESFSVQTRIFNTNFDLKAFEINKFVSDFFVNLNYNLNINNPEQIISIIINTHSIYIGFSFPKYNLSSWSGGEVRFKKNEDLISRAEFKLLEAIEVFNLKNLENKSVLDLGAAPGGWSKIFLDINCNVTSVDPAFLNEKLLTRKKITHEKKTAEEFFQTNKNFFEIITNDMKMDINKSIDIMILSKNFSTPDGIFILTLKLPNKGQQKITNKSLKILEKHFKIIGAKQLFHNRSEVTVIFKNK